VAVAAAAPTDLLERGDLLAALADALAEARRGRGGIVFLAGEAGSGKTSVVRRFCEQQGDVSVHWGACEPLFAPHPLGPLLELEEAARGELAAALHANEGPHRIAAALLELLRGRPPGVLVLEDLHWADEATLDVLRLLARRVESAPVLVVATYRDDELGRTHALRIMLGELARQRPTLLRVEPLSPDAVAHLAGPAGVDAAELHRLTRGNPFFVVEALAGQDGVVPPTIRDAVLARVARLTDDGRGLLDAASVVPSRTELRLLDRLAGELLPALEECLASGMLVAAPEGVEFRHELARLAVEESLSPARRLELHRRALSALAEVPSSERDFVRLAHHAEAAGDGPAVLAHATAAAAAAAAAGAHREAVAQYGRALRFVDERDLETRASLLAGLADSSFLTDRCRDAIAAAEELVDCYVAAGDIRRQGEALSLLGQLRMCPGSAADAEPAARRAVDLLQRVGATAELATACANLAAVLMNVEDVEAVEWGERAIVLAEEVGAVDALVAALNTVGTVELLRGATESARVERSMELARAHGVELGVLRGHTHFLWAAARRRELHAAERRLEAGLALCREPDYDLWRLLLLGNQAWIRLVQGRWEDAVDSARSALSDPRSSPLPRILGGVVLALVRARRGDPHVWPLLDEAQALAAGSGELQRLATVAPARAEAAWLMGRLDSVRADTDPVLALAVEREAGWLVGELACWRRRAGIDETVDVPVAEPYALELSGRPGDAAESWARLGCPYDAALALAQSEDEASLRRAHAELQELGASAAAAVVGRRLRERGVQGLPRGPRASTQQNAAGLTTRELEVLALVVEGLRNGEIATRLHLSTRTVDHHVSAILRKLSARNRAHASAEAHRLGLVQAP
jgi:DNA-binding NarL/FixJ family response regulator